MRIRQKRRVLEKGQGLSEYALILVLVGVVVIVILAVLGQSVTTTFCDIVLDLGGHMPANAPKACLGPKITLNGIAGGQTVSGGVVAEILLADPKTGNPITSNASVAVYADGNPSPFVTETSSKYCLGTGNGPCNPWSSSSLTNGPHTLKFVATDTSTGDSRTVTIPINVAN